jgi:hypothetical protein
MNIYVFQNSKITQRLQKKFPSPVHKIKLEVAVIPSRCPWPMSTTTRRLSPQKLSGKNGYSSTLTGKAKWLEEVKDINQWEVCLWSQHNTI